MGVTFSLGPVRRDNAGVSLIETALVLPIIMMLLAGLVDFAMAFSAKLNTQQAAARTIEYATSVGLERLTFEDLRREAATAAKVPENQVVINRWLDCGQVRQSSFDGACDEGQDIARHVSVRISNSYRPTLGSFLPESVAPDGAMHFEGFSKVRLQ